MFGYVIINKEGLSQEAVTRYESYYCGLCRALKAQHGNMGRTTLSYDMSFLYILLSSLYEPEEVVQRGTCLLHPSKPRPFILNEFAAYAADMNIALAYHKCKDNWQDERKLSALAQAGTLKKAYARVQKKYPEVCTEIADCLHEIGKVEHEGLLAVDLPANLTGRMLGCIYASFRPEDIWSDTLREMGEALGRFIYMMDAYEDLPVDIRKHNFNPLRTLAEKEDYELLCRQGMEMLMAECTQAFEVLPVVQDMDILRNVLYSGVWGRYAAIQKKRTEKEQK